MAEESGKSGLEEVFRKKEDAIKAKETQEKKERPEGQKAKPAEEIIDEQQVTAQIDKAKKEIESTFLSDESRKVMSEALDKLIAKQGKETEGAETATREALIKLFDDTKTAIGSYEAQGGVKEVYDPLNKLFKNKKAYLKAINLTQYGLTDKKDQGYWATIQEELKNADITQDDVKKVQTILGLESDGKIGPKTIEATWQMLTGENKNVANVIREKGKTVKAKPELVDAIIAQDEAKEVEAKKAAVEAEATVRQADAAEQAQPTDTTTTAGDMSLDDLYSGVTQPVSSPEDAEMTPPINQPVPSPLKVRK